MGKLKHNKIKNVGVLFELLTRQITSDTLNGTKERKSPAISILKENFKKDSILLKEYNLYKALQKQKYKTEGKAEKFIDIVINEHNFNSEEHLCYLKKCDPKKIKHLTPMT